LFNDPSQFLFHIIQFGLEVGCLIFGQFHFSLRLSSGSIQSFLQLLFGAHFLLSDSRRSLRHLP